MNIAYNKEDIRLNIQAKDRVDAIEKAAQILIDSKKITEEYVKEMIDTLDRFGPYFVLAPGIAFPHSKPSPSVLETGISIATLEKPIEFGSLENDPVSIICVLASKDTEEHLMLLKKMVAFLGEQNNIVLLRKASSQKDINEIVEKLNNSI